MYGCATRALVYAMDTQIHDDIAVEAVRIVEAGEAKGIKLRLLGGLAIRLRTPSTERPSFARSYPDIDLATATQASHQIETLITGLGYAPDREFNMLNGSSRLLFFDPTHQRQIDVFVGQFDMCHQIPLADRLDVEPLTLPLAELLLTKLQIVQINEKDLRDVCALLVDHPVGDTDGETINRRRIGELCGKDWGLWKTTQLSLDKVSTFCSSLNLDDASKTLIMQRIEDLRLALNDTPKTLRWKARAAVGERVPWYNVPEEVQRG